MIAVIGPRWLPVTDPVTGERLIDRKTDWGMFQKLWEPFVDGGDVDGGFVAAGEFVVAGGDGAVVFEPVDAAFNGVALAAVLWVELVGPATTAATLTPAGRLIGLDRDGRRIPRRRR